MKQSCDFSVVRTATTEPKTDEQGGLIPLSPERAKDTDFITLPEKVEGTNCANCSVYFRKIKGKKYGFCLHPLVDMPVNNRNCCKFWDAYGTGRHFDFERTEEILSGSNL
jgi:hypothetical protein